MSISRQCYAVSDQQARVGHSPHCLFTAVKTEPENAAEQIRLEKRLQGFIKTLITAIYHSCPANRSYESDGLDIELHEYRTLLQECFLMMNRPLKASFYSSTPTLRQQCLEQLTVRKQGDNVLSWINNKRLFLIALKTLIHYMNDMGEGGRVSSDQALKPRPMGMIRPACTL